MSIQLSSNVHQQATERMQAHILYIHVLHICIKLLCHIARKNYLKTLEFQHCTAMLTNKKEYKHDIIMTLSG